MQKLDKQFIKRVRLQDRIATRVITLGGLLVIASVIAILILIVRVTIPLFQPAQLSPAYQFPLSASSGTVLAMGVDDYREIAFVLDDKGVFTFYSLASGLPLKSIDGSQGKKTPLRSVAQHKNYQYSMVWADGSVSVNEVSFRSLYGEDGKRTLQPELKNMAEFPVEKVGSEAVHVMVRIGRDGEVTRVMQLTDNSFHVTHQRTSTDLFGNEKQEQSSFVLREEIPGQIKDFTVDESGHNLYAGTSEGNLLHWDISPEQKGYRLDNVVATVDRKPITAMALIFGDVSLAVGDAGGGLATWSPVATGEGAERVKKLRKIHELTPHNGAVVRIVTSCRTKSLASFSATGIVHYDHMTSNNHLFSIERELKMFGMSGSNTSLAGLDRDNQVVVWKVDSPHPEINLRTLFGKVWYESYNEPVFAWQSSAGNDDFEPKFSLVPLLFGTIKGTLYSMLFAVPLSIFGAVYTSQFTSHGFKKNIKPMIEIMASVPSVVIGFLVALWLGPIVEKYIVAFFIFCLLLPLVLVLLMMVLQPFYKTPTLQNRCNGYEFLLLTPVVFAAGFLSFWLAPGVEQTFFDGNFLQWLYSDLGVRYDQRNSIIIAFGLGIAVIPIIFSITEDAISNIPNSLTGASLALGASRWQTIWRVVLPSASPGIFAAIMIGFGRAVGETMIVLMATGNTPIMDWSLFNGMRTLSANIAVEIPEAPFNGTLYRVLFLCATLLFFLTFILNTGAEVVRERLRKKYGRY